MKIRHPLVLLLLLFMFPLSLHAQTRQSPSLLATKAEVDRFFSTYVELYSRKDVQGFLSLFSVKAIQNKKDDLEAIRKIYTDFFSQSLELRYQIEEVSQEIYENGVEVKARYLISQVLKGNRKERGWNGRIRWILVKEDGILKILSLDHQHERVS